MRKLFYLFFFNLLIVSFFSFIHCDQTAASDGEPVYLSIVLHYEESFVQAAPYFLRQRNDLITLAEFLFDNDMKLNLQPDWAFMQAISTFEDESMRLRTNGKNILLYLVEDLNHEVNPHAHEHGYNYADVAYMISTFGVDPGNLVGGLIVDPPEDSKYAYLTQPISANHFDFTWQAQWLWGDATSGHVNDTSAAGVWRPKDSYHFYENDDQAPLPCIGKYINNLDGVYDLIERSKNGDTEPGRMLTATIFIAQGNVPEMYDLLVSELDKLKSYEGEKKIVFASLSEIGEIWTDKYNSAGYLYIHPKGDDLILYVSRYGGCSDHLPCYSTIADAYQYAESGIEIRVASGVYPENLLLNRPVEVTLSSGWNIDYDDNREGHLIIAGPLIITEGVVVVDKLIIAKSDLASCEELAGLISCFPWHTYFRACQKT